MLRPLLAPVLVTRRACGAVLGLVYAGVIVALPDVAQAGVTVTGTGQTFSESFFSSRLIFSRTFSGPTLPEFDGRFQSEISSSGTPTTSDMQFATTYQDSPMPSGTFAVRTRLAPGLAGQGSQMITSLIAGYSVSFTADQPVQLVIFGSSQLTRGSTTNDRPGRAWLTMSGSTLLSWFNPNDTGDLATLNTRVDLAPGDYRLGFDCGFTASERIGGAPASPTTIDFNMSFAIIPAPATSTLLLASLIATTRRRR